MKGIFIIPKDYSLFLVGSTTPLEGEYQKGADLTLIQFGRGTDPGKLADEQDQTNESLKQNVFKANIEQ